MSQGYLTVAIASKMMMVRPDHTCSLIAAGELKASNIASKNSTRPRWIIKQSDFDAFLDARSNQKKKPAKKKPAKKKRAAKPLKRLV